MLAVVGSVVEATLCVVDVVVVVDFPSQVAQHGVYPSGHSEIRVVLVI